MGPAGGSAERPERGRHPLQLNLIRLAREARRTGRPIGVDTPALIAYLEDREPADLLARLFEDDKVGIVLSTVCLAEVLTLPALHRDVNLVHSVRQSIISIPGIRVLVFDEDIAEETARVRALTGLKLPDAAIIATARITRCCALIGNDKRWQSRKLGLPYLHLDDLVGIRSDTTR